MTRTPLVLLLSACAPVEGTIVLDPVESDEPCYVDNDGDGYYYPTTPDCHGAPAWDYDDSDPDVTEGPTGNADNVPQWYSTVIVFDFVEDNGDIQEPALRIDFSDGTWKLTEVGYVEIAPSDPTTIVEVTRFDTMTIVSVEDVFDHSTAIMVSEEYDDLGDMAAKIDGSSVVFTDPESG